MIGVDIGGTNVRACAYFEDGSAAGPKCQSPSDAQAGTDAIFAALEDVISKAMKGTSEAPTAIGLSIPGHIDDEAGVVRWAPNFGKAINGVFQYWTDVQVRKPLEDRLKLPVRLENDANLAALGEYKYGSGKNSANCLVLLTVGTGIGGGVIMGPRAVNGKVSGPVMLVGGNKGGAELGHTIIQHGGLDCNSGEYGSIEGYCQRDSIVHRALNRIRRGRKSKLEELTGGDWSKVTPAMLSQAADQGDELALEVWHEVGTYLGVGIGNFINVFAPDVFAIGGQIAKAGEKLLGPARATARNVAIPSLFRDVNIVQAEQVEDAGMLGAAALAMQD